MALDGLADVLKRLDKELEGIEDKTMAGAWDAGLQIQRAAQQRLRPSVVTGNLRASAYTRSSTEFVRVDDSGLEPEKNNPVPARELDNAVEIGFTANYAIYAHENMEGNRAPKFLESAVKDNEREIVQIIAKRARV